MAEEDLMIEYSELLNSPAFCEIIISYDACAWLGDLSDFECTTELMEFIRRLERARWEGSEDFFMDWFYHSGDRDIGQINFILDEMNKKCDSFSTLRVLDCLPDRYLSRLDLLNRIEHEALSRIYRYNWESGKKQSILSIPNFTDSVLGFLSVNN